MDLRIQILASALDLVQRRGPSASGGEIAGIQGDSRPDVERKLVLVGAGDHGVTEEGVSAFPQAVTAQMVANFLRGGAAINVLARQCGARVLVARTG